MGNKITSTEVKKALHNYHSNGKDFFITECKNGSTYCPPAQGLLIFDGLAITKSYANPCIKGYEIKVSRGDFLQDGKWHLYLQYCNEFYFVVPKGLIKKEELPENVGLMYYDQEKGTLRKVKKALYRQIEEPVELYKYIIYSRMEKDRIPFYSSRAEYAKDYIKDRAIKNRIGVRLGGKMAEDLQVAYKKLDDLSHSHEELENWRKVEKLLKKHDILGWRWYRDGDEWLNELEQALLSSYPKELDDIKDSMQRIVQRLEKVKEEYNPESPPELIEIEGYADQSGLASAT